MKSFFFFPPLPNFSGGMFVIVEMAQILHKAGYDTVLVVREAQQKKQLQQFAPDIPVCLWEEVHLTPEDRWIVPEGWPSALSLGLVAKAHCLLYVQNWAYLHGHLPQNCTWQNLPVQMLAVSDPVAWFVRKTTGQNAPILRPSIDTNLFYPAPDCKNAKKIRIAWMPRKNKALSRQIHDILEASLTLRNIPQPEWLEIHGRSRQEVGELLRTAHIFLASGFPEGCPLPPLEAMACGCLVVGFSGFGGWDYMRQVMPNGCSPICPLRNTPWGANAFVASDGDVMGAVVALEQAIDLFLTDGTTLAQVRQAAMNTASWYSPERQKETLLALWAEKNFWNNKD